MSKHDQEAFTWRLGAENLKFLEKDWLFWARDSQLPPDQWGQNGCFMWNIRAGRGFGKTRTGAETFIYAIKECGYKHPNLAGATSEDVRDLMIEGESGILACATDDFYPEFVPTLKKLIWPNGVVTHVYYGTEPDKARGPQSDFLWCDELAKWQYPEETLDNLLMGLRLGPDPRCLLTSTPRPTKFLMEIEKRADPLGRLSCCVTLGHTQENFANLSDIFISTIISKYEGTRLGRQELEGEFLDDNPDALWRRAEIDKFKVAKPPEFSAIVVGVDPAAKSEKKSDDTGIIVAAKGYDGHGYILEDATMHGTPAEWATAAITAFHKYKANWIVAEVNQGGEMVEYTIQSIEKDIPLPYKPVHATRGKEIRAEPISALYQQGRVHHVGNFKELEDEMCLAGDSLVQTELGEVRLDKLYPGIRVYTREGLKPVIWAGKTGSNKVVYEIVTLKNRHLLATDGHLIYVEGQGYTKVSELQLGDVLSTWKSTVSEYNMMEDFTQSTETDITKINTQDCSTELCGEKNTEKSVKDSKYTTLMETDSTLMLKTSKPVQCPNTTESTHREVSKHGTLTNTVSIQIQCGVPENQLKNHVSSAEKNLNQQVCEQCTVLCPVEKDIIIGLRKKEMPQDVYNIKVEDIPEYYANGILVHNCEWMPNAGMKSPNRIDALVWAVTALNLPTGNARVPGGMAKGASFTDYREAGDWTGF